MTALDDIELQTDDYGVTHVYADDRYGLAFGQGYAQARDRLFQLDVLRHIARGDSASVLGPDQLPSDVQVRRDLYSESELRAQLDALPESGRTMFEGFTDGVNAALADRLRERDVPAEFVAVGHVPEPWTLVDSAAVGAYILGYFGVFGGDEFENALRFARLESTLGDGETAWRAYGDLNRRRVDGDHYTTIDPGESTVDGGEDALDYDDVPEGQFSLARAASGATPWGIAAADAPELTGLRDAQGALAGFEWGSNAVAVAGEHTESGHPLLFGGPQMRYFRPPIVHEVGLHGADFDCVGCGVVGLPSVYFGRTTEFAWSVTSGYDDMVDTLAVRLHPEDRHRYDWGGEWREMRTETVVHRPSTIAALTDGSSPRRRVTQELAFVDEDGHEMPVVAWNPEERVAWIQRATTRGDELRHAAAMTEIPTLGDAAEAADHLAEFPFSFNFLLADEEAIHYVHCGRVPERDSDYDWRLPVPGGDGRWEGISHTVADYGMAASSPERGYFAQWNNAPVAGWRAGDEEQLWDRVHRVDRLVEAVEAAIDDGPLSFEDVADLIETAGRHDPIALATAQSMADAGAGSDDDSVTAMADELADWIAADHTWDAPDGTHHPGLRIWEATREELQTRAFAGTLGDLAHELEYEPPREVTPGEDRFVHGGDHGIVDVGDVILARVFAGEAAYDWLGDDPAATVRAAMARAGDHLQRRFGSSDPSEWRQPERTVKFSSMGALPEVDVPIVHRGTFNFVVDHAGGHAESVLPPANTGHVPLRDLPRVVRGEDRPHHRDQLHLYESFDYKPMPLAREEVERQTVETRTIRAQSAGRLFRLRALLGR